MFNFLVDYTGLALGPYIVAPGMARFFLYHIDASTATISELRSGPILLTLLI